jgi:hypothetical protein
MAGFAQTNCSSRPRDFTVPFNGSRGNSGALDDLLNLESCGSKMENFRNLVSIYLFWSPGVSVGSNENRVCMGLASQGQRVPLRHMAPLARNCKVARRQSYFSDILEIVQNELARLSPKGKT